MAKKGEEKRDKIAAEMHFLEGFIAISGATCVLHLTLLILTHMTTYYVLLWERWRSSSMWFDGTIASGACL